VPDQSLLATATETAQKLAEKTCRRAPSLQETYEASLSALSLCKQRKLENEEFSVRLRSADSKEAITAVLRKNANRALTGKTDSAAAA